MEGSGISELWSTDNDSSAGPKKKNSSPGTHVLVLLEQICWQTVSYQDSPETTLWWGGNEFTNTRLVYNDT